MHRSFRSADLALAASALEADDRDALYGGRRLDAAISGLA
jgi:hypothetical protein